MIFAVASLKAILLVLLGSLNCFGQGGRQEALSLTLTLPRAPAPGEAIRARVNAGVLPRGARLIVRTAAGKIVGAVAPYGIASGSKAGTYTIPVPMDALADGKVALSFELKDKDGKIRPPTRDELEGAELVLVPVSASGKNHDSK